MVTTEMQVLLLVQYMQLLGGSSGAIQADSEGRHQLDQSPS